MLGIPFCPGADELRRDQKTMVEKSFNEDGLAEVVNEVWLGRPSFWVSDN